LDDLSKLTGAYISATMPGISGVNETVECCLLMSWTWDCRFEVIYCNCVSDKQAIHTSADHVPVVNICSCFFGFNIVTSFLDLASIVQESSIQCRVDDC